MPKESRIITSDDVFDMLLDFRSLNIGVDEKREDLFDEYYRTRKEKFVLSSLDDYEELKRHREAKSKTKSAYVSKRLPKNISSKSNGESAYAYFTKRIPENALCLLDEPENSLSVMLQKELAAFVADSARFFGTQFIISTHSPFFLSLDGATVYDLDTCPVRCCRWSEVEAMKTYYDFFKDKEKSFL
jgi:predicted ATPase